MGSGKKKIKIKKIMKESSRMVTFSKRRKGLFKKAQEFHTRTNANIAIVVFSPAGKPYVYRDAECINAAFEACLRSCNKDNGTGSSTGGEVGCDNFMVTTGGYDGGFGGASSSAPAAAAGLNADMMGCNGVDAGCFGGFLGTTSSAGCSIEAASDARWDVIPVEAYSLC